MILYTGYGDDALLSDALDAGVGGVIDKEAPLDDLVRAIQIVAEGGTYLDPTAAAALIAAAPANRNARADPARARRAARARRGQLERADRRGAVDLAADRAHARAEGDGEARRDDARPSCRHRPPRVHS